MATLEQIIAGADKKYGPGTFVTGHAYGKDYPRIPTGIFSLDYSIGGGFPSTVTSSIYGPPAGGKSAVSIKVAVGAQSICWNCYEYLWDCECDNKIEQKVVIVPTEIFDMEWAIQLGLDPDKTVIVEPDSGEQAVDVMAECIQAEDCGLVILDSLPMLTPIVELEASAQEIQVGAQAKLITKFVRKLKQILVRQKKIGHPVAFVCTNQVRAKIGGFGFGPQEETSGGFCSKHDWHLTVRMSQLKSEAMDKDTDLPMYGRFKSSNVAMGHKRKVFVLAGTAEFYITVSENAEHPKGVINDYKTVMRFAENSLLEKNPWRFNGEEFDKKGDIMEDWLDDDQKFLTAKRRIIEYYINRAKIAAGVVVET